jgi:glucokinase
MILVGDIGGTHSRFCLCNPQDQTLSTVLRRKNADFASFTAVLQDVLADQHFRDLPVFTQACLALAGPVHGSRVALTNRPAFTFDAEQLSGLFAKNLGRSIRTTLLNDFAALAHSLPYLRPQDWRTLIAAPRSRQGPFVVIGPGTGLGVGILTTGARGRHRAIDGEGGHVAVPVRTAFDLNVLRAVRDQVPGQFVDSDLVVSGSGLERLYLGLSAVQGVSVQPLKAEEITAAAGSGADALAVETVELCCKWLMRIAADLALILKPEGGIYLAGGVTRHLLPWLLQDVVRAEFFANTRMTRVSGRIPVNVIQAPDAALLGAGMSVSEQGL